MSTSLTSARGISFLAVLCLFLTVESLYAQYEPDLFFREGWKEIPEQFPITQEHVANENLILKLYGPGGDSLKKSHHEDIPNDPYYLWSGTSNAPWAVTFKHRSRYVDLSENASVKWRTQQSGLHRLHIILKLENGSWLIGDQSDGAASYWRVREFLIDDITWYRFDVEQIREGSRVENPDLTNVVEIGVTDLRRGGGSGACSRLDWIEVYGVAVDP